MIVCKLEHLIPCPAERFWELYFDSEVTRQLFVDGLGWEAPMIGEYRETSAEIVRKMSARPKLIVGGQVAKIIGEKLGYREEGRFDRGRQIFEFSHRTSVFGERLELGGFMRVHARGTTQCLRAAEIRIRCPIFGIGGLIEKAVEVNVYRGWNTSAEFFRTYAERHPQAQPSSPPPGPSQST